jgi:hypothetical protein
VALRGGAAVGQVEDGERTAPAVEARDADGHGGCVCVCGAALWLERDVCRAGTASEARLRLAVVEK